MLREQGMTQWMGCTRRDGLRRMAGAMLTFGLLGPVAALAGTKEEDLVERYPWMASWITQDHLERAWLESLFTTLEPDSRVIRFMDHQAEAKPYYEYRARVLNKQKFIDGRLQMKKHRALLSQVAAAYSVSPEYVVALWGMESDFGRSMGQFNILRTLFTLAAHYPRRADYFQSELRAFLLLCREEGWNPRQPKGSYAGAIGQVQMMPATLRRFAVDFNHDGKRDVLGSVPDSLASIAAFLHGHEWRLNAPLAQILEPQAGLPEIFSANVKTKKTWREWRTLGISWPKGVTEPVEEESLSLILLEEQTGSRYYMTFMNFWVITQWNRSNRFAMAVHEFARALR
ncbi:MAG: lytic murein transglycosylase [Magnetococcales bacterium]|nr:lytic murein transglycosylase [Magnetococcales bacterium]